jgi:uncharacterized protein YbjT (DUF2867 family)
MPLIAVTGATGNVGHALATLLRERGMAVRAIGRNPDRLAELAALGAESMVGSLDEPRFASAAFRGADAAFVMHPLDYTHPDPRTRGAQIVEAIGVGLQVARVKFAVSLSSIGADQAEGNGPIGILHRLEGRISQVPGLAAVHLRPGFFFENFLMSIGLIHQMGTNGGAWNPELPVAMIASRDVAVVAADLLSGKPPAGQSVRELHGPREYSHREASAILGAAIGKPDLGYAQFSPEDTRQALVGMGISGIAADSILEMIHGFCSGHLGSRQPRSARSTTPTTLEEFARTVFAPAFRV